MTARQLVLPEIVVDGKRLGRHVNHDETSKLYQARRAIQIVDVNWLHHGGLLNQLNTSGCTGNALTDAVMTEPLWRAPWNFTEDDALRRYSRATAIDPFPGVFTYPPPGGQDTGSDGISVCKAGIEAGWLVGYDTAFGLQHVLEALVLQPVICGVPWFSGFDNPRGDGLCLYGGNNRGGHEICLLGIDTAKHWVWGINSWGNWGLNGLFAWEWTTLDALLQQQGDCTVPRVVPASPQPPPPPPPPPPPGPTPTPTVVHPYPGTPIRYGMRNKSVTVLQQRLAEIGYAQPVTAYFGVTTRGNVMSFQASRRLGADGIVGPATWGALFS